MTCDEQADWIATEARKPGLWQWARSYARECEADDSGQWAGLVAKVRERLGTSGQHRAKQGRGTSS